LLIFLLPSMSVVRQIELYSEEFKRDVDGTA